MPRERELPLELHLDIVIRLGWYSSSSSSLFGYTCGGGSWPSKLVHPILGGKSLAFDAVGAV